MKTQIITIFAALALSAGVAATTYATPVVKNNNVTVLTDISVINKIEIRGNVELYISNSETDQVKVYNKYYAENALVQGKNGVLRITSYNAEKLVVWVSANDIRAISAFDNSEVRTFGDFSGIDFSMDLHNNASAKLNIDAFNASVVLADQAKATLSGKVDQYDLKYNQIANVTYAGFEAVKSTVVQTGVTAAIKVNRDEFAGL